MTASGAGVDASAGIRLGAFVQPLAALPPKLKDDNCSICTFKLDEAGMCDDDNAGAGAASAWSRLRKCGHTFHRLCFETMADGKSFVQCPQCKKYYGQMIGNQPLHGTMTVQKDSSSLPGYEGYGTLSIKYSFPRGGFQGPEHPHPGQPYHLVGFPRVAYLPDNKKGRQVAKLLKKAFDRRLIFTVGMSTTSGTDDCVTWNDIHHKTSKIPGHPYGFPDPTYLDNVLAELAQHGVVDK